MPSVLITGANRGLGLEFARQFATDGWRVHATCRMPADAAELRAIAGHNPPGRLTIHALDVRDRSQVQSLAAELAGQPIDVLLNNAAVWGPQTQTFSQLEDRAWIEVLEADLLGVVRVTEAFLEHVARSERKVIIALSSRLASITLNETGGRYMYRAAKAGANAVVRSLAVDLASRGITCIALTPGWVRTDMGGPNAPLSVEESVTGMRRVIAGLDLAQSGRFLAYDGSTLPW
jgi:NAD(P)-dependent dehydrogenase (short-subunit alcohol dehydrogenase family)